jgi:hypothetical protein
MGFSYCHRKTNTFWRFLAGSTSAPAVTISQFLLDMSQNCNTLLTSLNVLIIRGLEQFQSLSLAKSAEVTSTAKDDWSRAGRKTSHITAGIR